MTTTIAIIKCHGSGNDFILIDEYFNAYELTDLKREVLSIELCKRDSSIGADGILFFQKSTTCDAKMRMFNPDGSEAEMCGNGIRCIGRYASEKFEKEEIFIETLKGRQKITKQSDIADGVKTFSVNMKPISLQLSDFPIHADGVQLINKEIKDFSDLKFTAVSIGNPHLISICEQLDVTVLKQIGASANSNKALLPEGVNVSFCQIIHKNKIVVITYERGAGITYACGSAMTASSLTSVLLGHCATDEWIEIYNKGGITKCKVTQSEEMYEVHLLGNATFVFDSQVAIDFERPSDFTLLESNSNTAEINAYANISAQAEKLLADYHIVVPD